MGDITQILLDAIDYGVDKKLEKAQFDRTIICSVISIHDKTVTLSHGSEEFILTLDHTPHFNIFDKVHLKFPSNNPFDKYIEEDVEALYSSNSATSDSGGSSPSGTSYVFSVNGKKGNVVIGIDDIDGLREELNNRVVGEKQIIMNKTMPVAQTIGNIWYEED